jgi:hypothetical protein
VLPLVTLQDDDDDKHCCAWAVLLEDGGDQEHKKIFIHAWIKKAWNFVASNGLY